MNDRLRESVSALVDGEASELELRRMLGSTDSAEVRERWKAYQLTRGALAGDSLQFAHIDLSARVAAAIDAESVEAEESGSFAWRKSLAGLAVAATVAAVIVMGGQTLQMSGESEAAIADSTKGRVYPAASASAPVVHDGALSADFSGISPAAAIDPDREAEDRLERFLLQHTERAAGSNGQGMISFARVPAADEQVESAK